MEISIDKAKRSECKIILEMQLKAFAALLQRYQDFDTSPGNETIEDIYRRYDQNFTDYYLIKENNNVVGAIRIIRIESENTCRVSPIFILPEYQGKGIAQKVFNLIESLYTSTIKWKLDTILEEKGNCYLYEKIGYKKIGREEMINDKMTIVYYEKRLETKQG